MNRTAYRIARALSSRAMTNVLLIGLLILGWRVLDDGIRVDVQDYELKVKIDDPIDVRTDGTVEVEVASPVTIER